MTADKIIIRTSTRTERIMIDIRTGALKEESEASVTVAVCVCVCVCTCK